MASEATNKAVRGNMLEDISVINDFKVNDFISDISFDL